MTDWLYRHRGTTAVPFAALLLAGAQPTLSSVAVGGLILVAGETLRLWAASVIGPHSRGLALRSPRLVTEGPYALLRHPLYVGNALACAGLLAIARSYWPWLPLGFAVAFTLQYALFTRREESYLEARWGDEWRSYRRSVPRFGSVMSLRSAGRTRFAITPQGWRLEWPTLRTILGLCVLIGAVTWVSYFLRR